MLWQSVSVGTVHCRSPCDEKFRSSHKEENEDFQMSELRRASESPREWLLNLPLTYLKNFRQLEGLCYIRAALGALRNWEV